MSLPHALLGLIQYKPATGYDLKTAFQKSITFFWDAALPHIYRTLKQMEVQDWIASTIEHQEGKPSRKIYRITKPGEKEFQRWLAEAPETPEPRYPMLVKIFFGNQMPPDQIITHLKQWREAHLRLLQKFDKEVLPVIQNYSTKVCSPEDPFYWALTLDFGRRHARMVVEWCDQALKDMVKVRGKKRKIAGQD
jgi:PadR family transcriptional regulator, regulatory protein AphA